MSLFVSVLVQYDPFYIVYGITKLINKFKLKQKNANEEKVLINNEDTYEKLYEYNLTNKNK